METHKEKYLKYLRSKEWAAIKVDLITIHQGKCENCGGSQNLQVHHLTYDNLFFEEPEDLLLLCSRCHMVEHGLIKKRKSRKPGKAGMFNSFLKKAVEKYGDVGNIRSLKGLAVFVHKKENRNSNAIFKKKRKAIRYLSSNLK